LGHCYLTATHAGETAGTHSAAFLSGVFYMRYLSLRISKLQKAQRFRYALLFGRAQSAALWCSRAIRLHFAAQAAHHCSYVCCADKAIKQYEAPLSSHPHLPLPRSRGWTSYAGPAAQCAPAHTNQQRAAANVTIAASSSSSSPYPCSIPVYHTSLLQHAVMQQSLIHPSVLEPICRERKLLHA
jgi:hypothetical protein